MFNLIYVPFEAIKDLFQNERTFTDYNCPVSCTLYHYIKQLYFKEIEIWPFAFKHKPQTFSRVCLRLKRRVCHFKRRVCRWKRDCYRSANGAAILGVTVVF